jgi:hypothetical protein
MLGIIVEATRKIVEDNVSRPCINGYEKTGRRLDREVRCLVRNNLIIPSSNSLCLVDSLCFSEDCFDSGIIHIGYEPRKDGFSHDRTGPSIQRVIGVVESGHGPPRLDNAASTWSSKWSRRVRAQ